MRGSFKMRRHCFQEYRFGNANNESISHMVRFLVILDFWRTAGGWGILCDRREGGLWATENQASLFLPVLVFLRWFFFFFLDLNILSLKKQKEGLPWWRSGWESACQCRGHGFEPWSGKVPHAAGQLGPWATTTEPACLEPVLCNERGCDSERTAHHDEDWPPLATTREGPRTETKDPTQP